MSVGFRVPSARKADQDLKLSSSRCCCRVLFAQDARDFVLFAGRALSWRRPPSPLSLGENGTCNPNRSSMQPGDALSDFALVEFYSSISIVELCAITSRAHL